jgi:muramoyltetrapeptide carboxypeptidase
MPVQPAAKNPRKKQKPAALLAGDVVGVVAPASPVRHDQLEAGCAALERMGYRPFFLSSIFDEDSYFAGSAERRAQELEEMFVRDEVKAIICARGGYGSNYLSPRLDLKKIAKSPKIFMGYSDNTSLLTWLADEGGLVTFHGPMVAKDFALTEGIDVPSWQAAVSGQESWDIPCEDVTTLCTGTAEGVLYGGCLSMLAASLGTPYEIKTEGTILFLEDVNAKPFQIDRMLVQLKLAGKLDGVRGVIFGEMLNCASDSQQVRQLHEGISRIFKDARIPVAFGLSSGHVSTQNITLPLGVRARLSVDDKVSLTILEAACVASDAVAVAAKRK